MNVQAATTTIKHFHLNHLPPADDGRTVLGFESLMRASTSGATVGDAATGSLVRLTSGLD